MKPLEAAKELIEVERYLYWLAGKVTKGGEAQVQLNAYAQAVNTARAYIIGRETMDAMQEDDGK